MSKMVKMDSRSVYVCLNPFAPSRYSISLDPFLLGLQEYLAIAHFDQVKSMKPLYSKVLAKMKAVKIDD